MAAAGFAAVYTTHPANRRYLSGYTGEDHPPDESAGALLITPDAAYLRTSVVNAPQARADAPDFTIVAYARRDEAAQQLQEIAARHAIRRLGFDESAMLYHDPSMARRDVAGCRTGGNRLADQRPAPD